MLKLRNLFRVMGGTLFALCLVFVTNSAWAEYTITVDQNGGTGSNLLSTLYAVSTDEYVDYGGVSYDPLCFMYMDEAAREGETEDTSCIIAGNVYADYYLVNITNNSYHNYSLPTKTGYKFNGYWSATSGGTQYINAKGQALVDFAYRASDATNDFTIYAQWTPNTYNCTQGQYLPANATSCSTCPAGYSCSGGNYSTHNSDQGLNPVAAGYFCEGGCYSAAPYAPGYGCGSNDKCGPVAAGYFSTGGGTSATPNSTINGEPGTGSNGCLSGYSQSTFSCGKISAGYYSTGGATRAIPSSNSCVGGKTCGYCTTDAQYSTGGAASCSTVSEGYHATGCDDSDDVCTGVAPNTYTVTYSCGTSDVTGTPPTSNTATYNSNYTPKANNSCAKANYTFAGWIVGSDNWNVGEAKKWTYTSNTTLYARWTGAKITITWTGVASAGTGFTSLGNNTYKSEVTYGGDIITPAAAVVANAGQTFLGWKFVKQN